MISFDYLTLKAFAQENSEFLTNSRIQKIQAPSRKELILTIRNQGETKKLYINIDPQLYHTCFISKENELKRDLKIPKSPTMFCMLLRKYLESSKITEINIPKYERILEIFVETYNELGYKIYLCLAVELMGKYSNIVLYNHDTNVIIGCCHNVGSEKSRSREMAGLLPYVYPPKQLKTDILNYSGEIKNLNDNFLGISKALASQFKDKPLLQIQNFMKLLKISPAIKKDFSEFTLFGELLENSNPQISVNEMIDEYFSYHQSQILIKNLKQKLFSKINQQYKKAVGTSEKIKKQIKKEEKAQIYRLYGDLLMANLYQLKDFSITANVFDYENNKDISIELDNTKTIKDNANKFYKLYAKSKTASSKLLELFEKSDSDKKYFEELLYNIEEAPSLSILKEILEEISEIKKINSFKSEILEVNFKNYKILIGQNNKQNDQIVSKLSDKDDLWFHIKDCPGSHVLLKNPLKTMPVDEMILYCAKLAKKYSKAKNSPKAGVLYTLRKNLKKPPTANLGYVIYKNEVEILVD